MPEFLPEKQAVLNCLKGVIRENYSRHGFQIIETPAIERLEILLAKAGGETEKQIYKVCKTTEEMSEADEGLRFDHTVPLARYVVEHENDLAFPLRAAQIGPSWRGERAQKGRFREFVQCDVDVIGRGELPLEYDADVIDTMLDAYAGMGLNTPVKARISNRKILSGFLMWLGVGDRAAKIYSAIDHMDKNPAGWLTGALEEIGLEGDKAGKIVELVGLHGGAEVLEALEAMGVEDERFAAGVAELLAVYGALGGRDGVEIDLGIVRGLDYYTGTVFEFGLPEYAEAGSIGGGGRYENLAEYFTEQKLPGVGGSIGLSRLFYLIGEHGLVDDDAEKMLEYAVVPVSGEQNKFAAEVARGLRAGGTSAAVVYLDKKLGQKLTYAAKIAQKAVVIGEEEVKSRKWKVKEFR